MPRHLTMRRPLGPRYPKVDAWQLAAEGEARSPRVLAVIRWPVGGIRTWCKYVYRKPQFERFLIDIIMPARNESAALVADLAEKRRFCQGDPDRHLGRAFAAAVVSRIGMERYSLVHSHGFTSAVVSVLPCQVMRLPHLVTIHETVLDHQYRDLRGRLIRRTVDETLRRVDCVHAVSFASRDNLKQAFPGAARCRRGVQVLKNGIDPSAFLAARATPCGNDWDCRRRRFWWAFLADSWHPKVSGISSMQCRCTERRNASVPDIAVLAVGGGGFKREEEQRVRSLGLCIAVLL